MQRSLTAAALFLIAAAAQPASLRIVPTGPRTLIINERMLPSGANESDSLNGPSLIRVPSWVKNPLGKYYLYFAHHTGKYIRLAYADKLQGPWKMYAPGALRIEQQQVVSGHTASPEAVVDDARKAIVLFYHGQKPKGDESAGQRTGAAVSNDGVHFRALNQVAGPAYFRVFRHGGFWYGIAGPGTLFESDDLRKPFRAVADIIGDDIEAALYPADLQGPRKPTKGRERFSIRHVGVDADGDRLVIYFSCVGHMPERVIATVVDMRGPVTQWRAKGTIEALRPEMDWEGAAVTPEHSQGGKSRRLENSLRDPAVFREDGKIWLVYAAAGEHGIGLVRVDYQDGR